MQWNGRGPQLGSLSRVGVGWVTLSHDNQHETIGQLALLAIPRLLCHCASRFVKWQHWYTFFQQNILNCAEHTKMQFAPLHYAHTVVLVSLWQGRSGDCGECQAGLKELCVVIRVMSTSFTQGASQSEISPHCELTRCAVHPPSQLVCLLKPQCQSVQSSFWIFHFPIWRKNFVSDFHIFPDSVVTNKRSANPSTPREDPTEPHYARH